MADALIEHGVEQPGAGKAENRNRQFGSRKEPDGAEPRDPIGDMAAPKASAAEPRHERGDDDGGGVDIGAGKNDQRSLPDNLVNQCREAGNKEDAERGRKHLSYVGLFNVFSSAHAVSAPLAAVDEGFEAS